MPPAEPCGAQYNNRCRIGKSLSGGGLGEPARAVGGEAGNVVDQGLAAQHAVGLFVASEMREAVDHLPEPDELVMKVVAGQNSERHDPPVYSKALFTSLDFFGKSQSSSPWSCRRFRSWR